MKLQVRTDNDTLVNSVDFPNTAITFIKDVMGGGTNAEVAGILLQHLLAYTKREVADRYAALNEAQAQATVSAAREQARSDAEGAF